MKSPPAEIDSTGWCRTTLGRPGIVPASNSSTDGDVAPVTATEQPSQLIPATQNTWTTPSGPSSLPPRPPTPPTGSMPKTAPACGTRCSFNPPLPVASPMRTAFSPLDPAAMCVVHTLLPVARQVNGEEQA